MIFGKLEYRFIWIVLGLSIRVTHLKVHEQLVPECGRKKGKDLKGSTLPRRRKKALMVE